MYIVYITIGHENHLELKKIETKCSRIITRNLSYYLIHNEHNII